MTTNLQEVVTDENLYNTIPGIALKYIQIMKTHLYQWSWKDSMKSSKLYKDKWVK